MGSSGNFILYGVQKAQEKTGRELEPENFTTT
jgi:hypothetical protein